MRHGISPTHACLKYRIASPPFAWSVRKWWRESCTVSLFCKTVSETSDAYRVLVKPANTELVIQRFEYCVDERTKRKINFTCRIRYYFLT